MRAFWDICGAFLGNNKKTLNIVVLQYFGKYIYLIEHCGISILGPRVRQGFMRRGEACFRHLNLNSNLIYTKLNYDDLYQTKPYTVGKVMMVIQRALYLKRFLRGKLP